MNIISWNIRGCNHARKIKTMERRLKKEKIDILFLQETKCKSETFDKLGHIIWKGCKAMEVDAMGMEGGMTIL